VSKFLTIFVTLPLLAACHAESQKSTSSATVGDAVAITSQSSASAGEHGLKIDTDGFKASLDIPGMALGGKDFDISGMKLYPGSEVHGMKVAASAKDGNKHGTVTVSFTSPAAPEAVLVHATAQAKAHDWSLTRNGNTLNGVNDEGDTLIYTVTPSGTASSGTIVLTDKT
jgi:hypothetical protein